MDPRGELEKAIQNAAKNLDIKASSMHLEHPSELAHGDYATNIAMVLAKEAGKNPKELAEQLALELEKNKPSFVEKIEVAGPGFINFYLSREFFSESIQGILHKGEEWGKSNALSGQKIVVEYTDPNPFKVMHIGHVMSNTIGESIARFQMFAGADARRVNYQGDVGMHVASAIWGLLRLKPENITAEVLGEAYTKGAKAFKENEEDKKEITNINKKIYERSDPEINKLYDEGRQVSLDDFELVYERLGTKFDTYYFESTSGTTGKEIVEQGLKNGIFEESEGAIIFPGEKHGLHTRVFINREGLPTYEAKDLGLAKVKDEDQSYDKSIIITANEIDEYFKVVLKAMELTLPELQKKTSHVSHGFLKLTSGKMSSRTGDVIAAKDFLNDLKDSVKERIEDEQIADQIGVAAIKYAILKQDTKKDIIVDPEKSLSFEGDSGPYLQYAHTRAKTLSEKSDKEESVGNATAEAIALEKLLYRFPEVIEKSSKEYAPHHVAQYLTELAASFNQFYAGTKVIGSEHEAYYLALAKAFQITMKNGLWVLGIEVPERM